jgi:hypothetical protein
VAGFDAVSDGDDEHCKRRWRFTTAAARFELSRDDVAKFSLARERGYSLLINHKPVLHP